MHAANPNRWQEQYRAKRLDEPDLLRHVADGATVYLSGATGLPNRFFQRLAREAGRFRDICLVHPMRRETVPLEPDPVGPESRAHLFHISDFSSDRPVIGAVRDGFATYRPNHPTESARLFPFDIDLLVAAAAPMDRHGYFSLGAFGGWTADFVPKAKRLVLEVNRHQPRVLGPNMVHIGDVAGVIEADEPLTVVQQGREVVGAEEAALAGHIAELITDGSTLQVGIGQVPEAIARALGAAGRKDLGVHSEALFDWMIDLYEAGIITNARKTLHRGKIVGAVALGSAGLYDFIDDNPLVEMHPISYVNDPRVISRNYRQVSVNSTIQIDLLGQCASEGIGPAHYSGTGGQWNFHYGTSLADDGLALVALLSTAKGETISRIVPSLPVGSAVSIPRNDIQFVATEHGVVDLRGQTVESRARLLISIAHPAFREELERQAHGLRLLPRTPHAVAARSRTGRLRRGPESLGDVGANLVRTAASARTET